ncbi:hypothetical protein Fmac_018908 [Flemingia macrophylla]|uniref:Uncharacterized protein n=1 Tax=Flemingia macrophylla TaxID=520843 RepID=A0ABD1M6E2_9FABA
MNQDFSPFVPGLPSPPPCSSQEHRPPAASTALPPQHPRRHVLLHPPRHCQLRPLQHLQEQPSALRHHRRVGHQTSSESWGIGRAISKIPRVPGSGTHHVGQGAFGNMCCVAAFLPLPRSGAINVNQNRYAMVSAIPSLVLASGNRVESVPKLPLVISDFIGGVEKTKEAIKVLKQIGAYPDAEKAKDSHGVPPCKGKMRNRHDISHKDPLIVYGTKGAKIVKAFRNVLDVEVANVEKLNLLKLAPGGHLGRFVI